MKVLMRFLSAPQRSIQIAIWVMLAAVLATAAPMLADTGSGAPVAPISAVSAPAGPVTPVGPVLTSASPEDTLSLAIAPPAGGTVVASVENPVHLLPAYRWFDDLKLPEDMGTFDGAKGIVTSMAEMSFALAGLIWWILLELMNFAMSMDIVASFAGAINAFFASTYSGLAGVGIPVIIGLFVALMAAVAAAKGKLNDSIRMGVSALLVLGLLQALGTAAVADRGSSIEATTSAKPPTGTPAWLAVTGNEYVNDLAGELSTLFGATAGITADVQNGTANAGYEADGGATCGYYTQRLYSTYQDQMASQSKSTAAAMSMVSFMWQRSLYDNFTQAAFANPYDGTRTTCHLLERTAGISPSVQQAIAGSDVAGSPYAGIGTGPFTAVGDKKQNQASEMAWAVCKDASGFRPGWNQIKHFEDDGDGSEACGKWWADQDGAGLTDAIGGALGWTQRGHLTNDTTALHPEVERMYEIKDFVEAYWGHNSGQRFMAGGTAVLTSALYAYAFGGPAIGVMLSQFVLLFMLMILPWTLTLFALPSKGGSRNPVGAKFLRLTGMAFGGKLLFMVVLGVTLTLMSALFSFGMNGKQGATLGATAAESQVLAAGLTLSGNMATFWSVLVPIVSIVAMKFLLKGAGLGNVMGINGAMGFATAAMKQGRDGKGGHNGRIPGLSTAGSKLTGQLTKGKDAAMGSRFGPKGMGSRLAGSYRARLAANAINEREARGSNKRTLSKDLAEKVASGKMSTVEAFRHQRMRDRGKDADGNGGLPDALAARVARGELSHSSARELFRAQVDRSQYDTTLAAKNAVADDKSLDATEKRLNNGRALPGEVGAAGPVFRKPGVRDPLAIEEDLTMSRAGLNIASASAKGELEWATKNTERLTLDGEALIKNTRADGSLEPLTLTQKAQAIAEVRAELPEVLHGNVLLGTTGAPAVVLPSFDAKGLLTLPDSALQDPHVAVQVLSNPLNYIEPAAVARRQHESEDSYHARLSLTMLETGLMDQSGNIADMISQLGIDRSKDGWQDRAIEMVREMKSAEFPVHLVDHFRVLDGAQLDRIQGAASHIVSTTPSTRDGVDTTAGRLTEITAAASSASDRIESVQVALERAMSSLDLAVVDPKELGKTLTTVLQQAEQYAPAAMSQALAVQLESKVLTEQLAGRTVDVQAEAGALRQILDAERRSISDQVARLKLTSADSNRDELLALGHSVLGALRGMAHSQRQAVESAADAATRSNEEAAEALRNQLEDFTRSTLRAEPPLS